MRYAEISDAIELYGTEYVTVSTDRDRDGQIDTDATNRMLAVVTNLVNSYLMGRLPIPLALPVAPHLQKLVVDLMIYEMCPSQSVRTDEKKQRYDDAMSWLKGVRDNKIKLTAADTTSLGPNESRTAETAPAADQYHYVESHRTFTHDKLKDLL